MLIPASATTICLCWQIAKAMAGMLPISRWKWVAEASLHSLSPVAWKILAFPCIGQSVSATNAAELHSAATCCTWGNPYVNGHVMHLASAETSEAVATFSRCISLFRSTGFSQILSQSCPPLPQKRHKSGSHLLLVWSYCPGGFSRFSFSADDPVVPNTLIRKGEID